MSSTQELWTSRFAFIMATAGAAVGLGNIWKFPYIAGVHGGGAFVLVYLLCVLLLGLPIMLAELLVGRAGQGDPITAIKVVATQSNRSPHWSWVGGLCLLSGFLILSYYSVIAGWALDYAVKAMTGALTITQPSALQQLFAHLMASSRTMIFYHTIMLAVTTFVVAQGVQAGIERMVFVMFPVLIILLLALLGYAVTTGYFLSGLSFLFHPNVSQLSAKSVLIALGHAFFTLSIAMGSVLVYGSYLPRSASIVRAATMIAVLDTLVALLAGLAIFPIVFANQLAPQAGPGLIFQTLPLAFAKMPYGQIVASLFFIMLVCAALTSTVSLLEPSVAWLKTKGLTRAQAATAAGFTAWLLGLGSVFSFNHWKTLTLFSLNFFALVDYLTANLLLPLGGLLMAIFVAWGLPRRIVLANSDMSARLFTYWHLLLRFFIPFAIAAVALNALGIIQL